MNADVIIIGSGFAGSIAAARLVDAGFRVMLLERGPWRKTKPVEAEGITDPVPFPVDGSKPGLTLRSLRLASGGPRQITFNKRGLLEIHIGKGLRTVASSSVGGGSHIWGGVVSRPASPDYWDKINDRLSEDLLAPHFEKVHQELGAMLPENASEIPNHTSYAWKDVDYFEAVPESDQLPLALLMPAKFGGLTPTHNRSPSTLDGRDGMFGSPGGAKASVDAIYLIPRLGKNLEINELHEVKSIARSSDNYEVAVRDHKHKTDKTFRARYVILAAGTMNTVKLLCESEDSGGLSPMPALGLGFGTNGDCVGSWEPGDQRDSTLGTGALGQLIIKGQEKDDSFAIFMGGGERPPLPSWLPKFIADKINKAASLKFQIIGMGADMADGTIRFENGRLKLNYSVKSNPVYEKIFTTFDLLSERSGRPVKFNRNDNFTCHPLGGCRISESARDSVVNCNGENHTNPGMYITDASVFPAPTGSPPSLNIAAWSSYVAEGLIKKLKEH
jgi:cholesterol oxidase